MKYKTLKSLSIFVAILFVISCGCTVLGYTTSKKEKEQPINPGNNTNKTAIDRNITYEYYLEEELVSEMPTNKKEEDTNETNKTIETNETKEEQLYKFDRFKCDPEITGRFDTEEWKFIPNKTEKSTCKLYFNKSRYNVALTVINGKSDDENNNYSVERYTDGVFKIIPNEGYEFSGDYQCSNDKIAEYDKSKNIFKISAVTSDLACKLTFVEKKLSFELTIKNGNCGEECDGGKIKKTLYFGEKTTFIVNPQNGYEFDANKLKCSNNQTATYASGNFSITPSSDTKCTIEFIKSKIVKHKISITNSEAENVKSKFSITQGSDEISVEDGGTGVIKIAIAEGVEVIPKLDCSQLAERSPSGSNEYTFTWMGVTKDIKCSIKEEPKPLE